MSKLWDKTSIQKLVKENPLALERAILAIYHRQTTEEQLDGISIDHNGIGFNRSDTPILTPLAVKIQSWTRHNHKQPLPEVIRRQKFLGTVMQKYWRQLLAEAEAKGHKVSYSNPRVKGRKTTTPEQGES